MLVRSLALALGLMSVAAPSLAQNVAYLRADCTGVSPCFTDVTSLDEWLWWTRSPSPSYTDPVTVLIGTGTGTAQGQTFYGNIVCDAASAGTGHVTFRGIGPVLPTIEGVPTDGGYDFTIYSKDCDEMVFENLKVKSPPNATLGRGIAAYWVGSGDSRWINVEVSSEYAAWYDSTCSFDNTAPSTGTHFVQGSTWSGDAIAWYADCGEAIFYDSHLYVTPKSTTVIPSLGSPVGLTVAGLKASHRAAIYLVDSTVSIDTTTRPATVQAIGLDAGGGGNNHPKGSGEVEMFGGSLSVKGKPDDPIYGARADKFTETVDPAAVRIQGTTLSVQNGTAAATVVAGDGELERVDLAP